MARTNLSVAKAAASEAIRLVNCGLDAATGARVQAQSRHGRVWVQMLGFPARLSRVRFLVDCSRSRTAWTVSRPSYYAGRVDALIPVCSR